MTAAPRATFELPLPGGRTLVLGRRTLVQGIVNATPDSFSDGGRHGSAEGAIAHALRLVDDGADLLDVGGESTRPGALEVHADEQRRRVIPVIEALARRAPDVPVSVDTRSAAVARDAAAAGAAIVNDVSGLAHDPEMRATVAELGLPAIVMHMRGTPADMRSRAVYRDVVAEVVAELRAAVSAARAAGVRRVIADPGIGFAKTPEQGWALVRALPSIVEAFAADGCPVLVGPSRKSFLTTVAPDRPGPDGAPVPDLAARDAATADVSATCAAAGVHIVRVHDVAGVRAALSR